MKIGSNVFGEIYFGRAMNTLPDGPQQIRLPIFSATGVRGREQGHVLILAGWVVSPCKNKMSLL
ncbi:MAG: hypothetical protein ACUBOA_10955 [Candidatus Loosdrechtia sp.]